MFRALMPISKTGLLKIVRQNAEDDNDRRPWLGWHIDAVLAIILGGAQFKEGTDLWATQRAGLMPPPDFGRFLSEDRFKRILRYWSRGLSEEREVLRLNPWATIDPWVDGFNDAHPRRNDDGVDGEKWVRGFASPVLHKKKAKTFGDGT